MGDVDSVFAISTTRLVNIEAEDTAVVTLRFRNGALGVIEATTATRPIDLEGAISIIGESDSVEIAGFAMNQMRTWNFTTQMPGDDEVLHEYSVTPPTSMDLDIRTTTNMWLVLYKTTASHWLTAWKAVRVWS